MREHPRGPWTRSDAFSVDNGDALVRTVTLEDGRSYEHRCSRKTYEEVCHAIEQRGELGTTGMELIEQLGVRHTQVYVALAFLEERGCADRRHRRLVPTTNALYLDAMTEFYALIEKLSG